MEDDTVREHLEVEQEGSEPGDGLGGVEDAGGGRGGGVERVRELSVLDRVQIELDDVEGALERLDAGSYGTCQTCGGPIDDERLAEVPATRFCGEHQADPAT